MGNTYSRSWGGPHPGCLIFLLDQSGSMSDPFGQAQVGAGKRKCDAVATILNSFLNELIVINTITHPDGTTEVRPRADIAVIGYEGSTIASVLGGGLSGKVFVNLPELQMNPIEIERRKKQELDDVGNLIEIPVQFPVWVKPKAGGGTPMCGALLKARDLAAQWASSHPNNYPPVVINVTDGMANDGDLTDAARQLTQISTNDGQTLLYNVHITHLNDAPVRYPEVESELPNDKYARQLFFLSSTIPDTSCQALSGQLGRTVASGARGLIFNGDAASIRQMFTFATIPATIPIDPNR